MLENVTLVAHFGKEDTAAESQSHAARTQDTLVNAVENAEVTEIIRAVFRALTRLRAAETKEFDMIARLETQTTRTTRPSDTKPCHTSSEQPCNRSTGAVKAARRAGETVETKRRTLSSSTQVNIEMDSLLDSIDSSFSRCRKHGSRS